MLLPYRARIAVAMVAIVLSAGMVLVIGQGLKVVIDEGFARGEARMLDATLASLAALIAALGVLTWFRVYNVYWIGARFTADLRQRVYDHLLTLSPGFYESSRTGEVSSRITNDVALIEAVMGGTRAQHGIGMGLAEVAAEEVGDVTPLMIDYSRRRLFGGDETCEVLVVAPPIHGVKQIRVEPGKDCRKMTAQVGGRLLGEAEQVASFP